MSKSNNDNPINGGEHVREQLSDYMDGLLSSDEREVVRLHLEGCIECRADYVELRATQKLMQNLPLAMAPRAFTLTPEMAEQVRKPSFWERLFVPRNAPRLATGSVVAFLLVIVVLAGTNGAALFTTADKATNPAALSSTQSTEQPSQQFSLKAVAEATATTAAAAAEAQSRISGSAGSTSTGEAQPPSAPAAIPSQPVPGSVNSSQAQGTTTDNGTQDGNSASITPNTTVANSGTGSPTTTTLSAATPPPEEGTNSYYDRSVAPSPPDASHSSAATSAGESRTGWVALQLGLLALGLALAAAALIAWRRT
jgi:anti-sigma factor RsiW